MLHSSHSDIWVSEILPYIQLFPSIICPLCAAERYFGRLSQVVTSLNTSCSEEHWTQWGVSTMTKGCYFFLTFDHSEAMVSVEEVPWRPRGHRGLSKYRVSVTEMDVSPVPHMGIGKLFLCISPDWERRCQKLSEQQLKICGFWLGSSQMI